MKTPINPHIHSTGFSLVELLTSIAVASAGIAVALGVSSNINRGIAVTMTDSNLVNTAQHIERVVRAVVRADSSFFKQPDPAEALRMVAEPAIAMNVQMTDVWIEQIALLHRISFVLTSGTPKRSMPITLYVHTSL